MTTAGFASGTRDVTTPSSFSRFAAVSSLLLGAVLVAVVPALAHAAFYIGVLAGASAVVALAAGYVLWFRASLVARAVAALAAAATLVGEMLQVLEGLPGARGLGRLTPLESALAGALAVLVLGLLLVDSLRRHPEQAPDHPYAL